MKTALITGITGQDGSYLAEFLLEKGYEVHGIIRRASSFNTGRIDHIYEDPNLTLHYGDLTDSTALIKLLYELKPDEVYNLGAQSHVRVSFDVPESTGNIVGLGAQRILEAIRETGLIDKVRYYQASSSEMFGKVQEVPQTEATPFWPGRPGHRARYCSGGRGRRRWGRPPRPTDCYRNGNSWGGLVAVSLLGDRLSVTEGPSSGAGEGSATGIKRDTWT